MNCRVSCAVKMIGPPLDRLQTSVRPTRGFPVPYRTEIMYHHWSLLVRIQAFNGGVTDRFYRFEHIVSYSSGKALSKQQPFRSPLAFFRQWKAYVLPRFRHKMSTAEDARLKGLALILPAALL